MKNFVKKIEETDSRIKMLLLVAIAYVAIAFGFNHVEAMTKIENYTPAINISIKDGANEPVGHLVQQATLQDVLNELEITLGSDDFLNIDASTLLEDNQTVEITRVTYTEEKTEEVVPFETEINGDDVDGASVDVLQVGENGLIEKTYKVRLENGTEVSRELINETIVKETINQVENYTAPVQTTVVAEGSSASGAFTGRLTTYGGDCYGCSGITAAGVTLNGNGANNSGSAKVFYNGGWYYVLAADRSIPFGTIIEISNHNLSLEPVIYGVVLDRGGDITGTKIDIFSGSEKGTRFFSGSTSYDTQFRIIG